jgi:hypothetical protein
MTLSDEINAEMSVRWCGLSFKKPGFRGRYKCEQPLVPLGLVPMRSEVQSEALPDIKVMVFGFFEAQAEYKRKSADTLRCDLGLDMDQIISIRWPI